MTDKNKLTKFWNELKRRKVVRVIIVYATTAFILLQLVDLLLEPLHLPTWVMTFFVVLLLVGFPIAVIFSWIFDITPQGVEITHSSTENTKPKIGLFNKKNIVFDIIIGILLIVVIILGYPRVFKNNSVSIISPELEKSIAVLPFIDDSPEEGHTYIVNGLMEEILNKLQKIKDLKVQTRASVEKYRSNEMSIQEISKELNVNYIVRGSGLKIGMRIKLMVQLIEAETGNSLWTNPYVEEVEEDKVFELLENVALSVAKELEAIITPEEKERIGKVPTENPTAYDFYLKAREIYANAKSNDDLKEAIPYLEKALEHDAEFAQAYAGLAIIYYYLDYGPKNGTYSEQINDFADKALLYDSESDWSLVAKSFYYINEKEYEKAVPYLEKALEYNPNSWMAIRSLAQIYVNRDDEKFLEYALKAVKIDIPLSDTDLTAGKEYDYLLLAVAFRSTGFMKEALMYFNKALEINPDYLGAIAEKSQVVADLNGDYQLSKEILAELFKKDSTYQTAFLWYGLSCYLLRDYGNALSYYQKWLKIIGNDTLDYKGNYSGRFAVVYSKLGDLERSMEYSNKYFELGEALKTNDKSYHLCAAYSLKGDKRKAIEQMRKVSQQNNQYYRIRSFKDDPIFDNIRELSEFKKILKKIETKYWKNHERIKANLKDKGLLPLKM